MEGILPIDVLDVRNLEILAAREASNSPPNLGEIDTFVLNWLMLYACEDQDGFAIAAAESMTESGFGTVMSFLRKHGEAELAGLIEEASALGLALNTAKSELDTAE